MTSIIIPTLFPNLELESYAITLSKFPNVSEVIVVVNGGVGEDKIENALHWRFLGKNKGFTGACNAGAKVATGEYLLFLNDDCEIDSQTLEQLVKFLETNPYVAATQPTVKDLRGNIENIGFTVDTKIGKAHSVRSADKFTNSNFQFSKEFAEDHNSRTTDSIYGLSGTCLLIRKKVFDEMGGFDESFHSYLEDVDLAIRLYKAGYKVAPCLDAEVSHEHMATSSKMGLYKETQDVKNWWRLILKHPDVFPLRVPLLVERLRNISGLIKKIVRIQNI